jgi:hypothetical protein
VLHSGGVEEIADDRAFIIRRHCHRWRLRRENLVG